MEVTVAEPSSPELNAAWEALREVVTAQVLATGVAYFNAADGTTYEISTHPQET